MSPIRNRQERQLHLFLDLVAELMIQLLLPYPALVEYAGTRTSSGECLAGTRTSTQC